MFVDNRLFINNIKKQILIIIKNDRLIVLGSKLIIKNI